jgi:hypothetical protein
MIDIEKIKGKYIYFLDKNMAFRISKVVAIHGNTITTATSTGEKERIHPQQNKIFGIVTKSIKQEFITEDIEFKKERIGKKLKNKQRIREINKVKIKPLTNKRKKRRQI